jgi:hypothetical protein
MQVENGYNYLIVYLVHPIEKISMRFVHFGIVDYIRKS